MDTQQQPEIAHIFKIILLGSTSVGKSQILMKFTKGTFIENPNTTIGVEFSAKVLDFDGKKVRVQVWDTAGQEKFRAIARAYYKGAVGALLVYDITEKKSFSDIERWLGEIRDYADQQNLVTMLIGNKCDMEEKRQVSKEEAIKFAQSKKMGFLETSAKSGHNIDFAFKQITEEILRDINEAEDEDDEFKQQQEYRKKPNQNASVLKVADHQDNKKKKKQKDEGCC